MKRILRIFLKSIAWLIAGVVILITLVVIAVQFPGVQTRIAREGAVLLEEKIGTPVRIDKLRIGFPETIAIQGLYLEDQRGDTLIYLGRMSVSTDLLALLSNEVILNHISVERLRANINRSAHDTSFNFSYIPAALAGSEPPDTSQQESPWAISLESLLFRDIAISFHDHAGGTIADVILGEFSIGLDTFDLENSVYKASEIRLTNSKLQLEQRPARIVLPYDPTDTVSVGLPDIGFRQLSITNLDVDFNETLSGTRLSAEVGNAAINAKRISIRDNDVRLKDVQVQRTFIAVHSTTAVLTDSMEAPVEPASIPDPWHITVDEVSLADNAVQYYDLTQPSASEGIDFSRLWITKLRLEAKSIAYSPDGMSATLEDFSFRERSGLGLTGMKGRITLGETEARLEDFVASINRSELRADLQAQYPSLQRIASNYQDATIEASVSSDIGTADLLFFQPSLRDSLPIKLDKNPRVQFKTQLSGTLADVQLRMLEINAFDKTHLQAFGTIKGAPDMESLRMDIILNKLFTTRTDLETNLSENIIPDSLIIPDWINIRGRYLGSMKVATTDVHLTSDMGGVDLNGHINIDSLSDNPGVDASLTTTDLNIGRFLNKPDSVLRSLSMMATVNLSGLSLQTMKGDFKTVVSNFFYNNYTYSDLTIDGTLDAGKLKARTAMVDDNLEFVADIDYQFDQEVPRYGLLFDLTNANFQALNLAKDPIRARGSLQLDLRTSDFQKINGNAGLRKVAIFNGDELYAIDSLLFASIDQEGRSEISITSDLFTADFRGSFNVFQLPMAMQRFINNYYHMDDTLEVVDTGPQHFAFNIELRNTELLTELLVPELKEFVPGKISGIFDSERDVLNIDIALDRILYGNIGIDSLSIRTRSDSSALDFQLVIDELMFDSLRIDGIELSAVLADDEMKTKMFVFDSLNQHKYVLAGVFKSIDEGIDLIISPDETKLNYLNWTVPPDNYIRFNPTKLIAHNVTLSHNREKILLASAPEPETPIRIGFRELRLDHFGGITAEANLVSGILNGDIDVYTENNEGKAFTADVAINDLAVRGGAWGDMRLQVTQSASNRFDVDFGLNGPGNDIAIQGFYQAGDLVTLNLAADVRRFALPTLQPLIDDQVSGLDGIFSGNLQITGSPQKPDLRGELRFSDVSFLSKMLNTRFALNDERIQFVSDGVAFNKFRIVDERSNEATIDGKILTRNYRDFRFNLNLNVSDFRLLNTREGDNEMFYGRVDLDARARITGDLTTPVISVDIGLSDGSALTYIVPQTEAAALQSEGIVKFVDRTFENDPFMKRIENEVGDTLKSVFTGIDLTARLALSGEETFSVVIDPVTGDQLTIRGNANLTLKIDPTGDMNLTGRYEINEGTYNFTFYKFVKREFEIEKGSSIVWMGDPLNAEMDIRAIFNIETAPIDLLSNQLTGADQNQLNTYRQRLPFLVYLGMSGELMKPEIGFEIDMPPDQRGAFNGLVYARLQDINTRESDLNKQVFALLILRRFISDDPFTSQVGGGLESTARRSVSKVLSDQLNRLSQNIKGIELSFDIKSYEDYSGGAAEGQTELELGVSKSLLNDRLVVKLSGNVDIEGRNSNRQATDYIGDLALEYKLTPDGRIRITGFRNSNYDMIDGELIETGAGLIYIKDYNALSELFKANAAKKK